MLTAKVTGLRVHIIVIERGLLFLTSHVKLVKLAVLLNY